MPLNEQIAQLYEDVGRAKAAGVLGAGQAWGQGLNQLGQQVGQIPNQIEVQKQRTDEQRARDARSALSEAMKNTPPISQDGLNLYDVGGIGKTMTDKGFGAEFAPAAQHFDTINQSMLNFQQARIGVVRSGATALAQTGADPTLTNDFLEHMKGNQVYDPVTIQKWQDLIKADPTKAQAIVGYLAGPQKIENAAPGSSARSSLTGAIVPGSQAPPLPGTGQHVINGQVVDASGNPVGAQVPEQVRPLAPEEVALKKAQIQEIDAKMAGNLPMSEKDKAELAIQRGKLAAEIAHNKATEAANNPLAALTGGGTSAPASAAVAEGAHGDDFLKTLPPNIASEVKAYAEGRRPFPAGFALKSPYFQSLIQMVGQYDPTFDAVNYNARAKTRQDFTAGKSAQTVNSLNTAIGHLDQLSKVSDQLGNFHEGSLGPLTGTANTLANMLSRASGSPKVTNFQSVVKPVADELTRVWRQSGGAEADIKNRLDALSASNTPEQLHGAIAEIGHLLESKLTALETQYVQGMGTTDTTGMQVVTPQSRNVLNKLESRSGGAAAPSLSVGQVVDVKGKKVKVTAVHPDGSFDGDEVK